MRLFVETPGQCDHGSVHALMAFGFSVVQLVEVVLMADGTAPPRQLLGECEGLQLHPTWHMKERVKSGHELFNDIVEL